MTVLDGYEIAWLVGQAFERIGVEYYLTGSMASSFQGPPRFTQDIDFVADLRVDHVGKLVEALGSDFDVDDVALTNAIKGHHSWNIFHTPTATRIDLFPVGKHEFDAEALARRQQRDIGGGRTLSVKTPEDTGPLVTRSPRPTSNTWRARTRAGRSRRSRGSCTSPSRYRCAESDGSSHTARSGSDPARR